MPQKTHPILAQTIFLTNILFKEIQIARDPVTNTASLTLSEEQIEIFELARTAANRAASVIETDDHPSMYYIIAASPNPEADPDDEDDNQPLYWSNTDGWTTSIDDAEQFTSTVDYALPMFDGRTVQWFTIRPETKTAR